jgi:hypothetical protein
MFSATDAGRALAGLGLLLAAGGCAVQSAQSAGTPGPRPVTATSPATPVNPIKVLAADYLAIARPANDRLEIEVDAYTDNAHRNLRAAESALRAEAATELVFDRQLLKIPFPPWIAAAARALVRANDRRIEFTRRQARSASIAALLSLDSRHKAADAAVETQVRIMRGLLSLPPPDNS